MSWLRARGRVVAPVLAAVASVALLLLSVFGHRHPSRTLPDQTAPPPPVGFSVPQLPFLSPGQLDGQLAGIRALGASWIRIDLSWPVVQPDNATAFDWSRYDRVVRAAGQHHLEVDGVIDYTAPWARLPSCADHFQCQPRSAQLYADFAGAAARHFEGSAVTAMEIWNEPNLRQFWLPAPNAAFYTRLLTTADRAIKAVDPDYLVITGGLSPASTIDQVSYSPLDFIDRIFRYGAQGAFDAVGYHPYTYPNLASTFNAASSFSQIDQTRPSLRSVLAGHGDANIPIWLTEVGAPTGGPGPSRTCSDRPFSPTHAVVSECLQAKLLSDALCAASRTTGLGPVFVYTYQDQGDNRSTAQDFFGVRRADGSTKPSYSAVAEAIRHPCR